ncbi:hypothetical protein OIO90_001110 [Microbotryomycetes sp. JL221]|nr:hypothetical protein OIO90_001110 [Microbotryomycetes sp. JL221]
MSSPPSSPPRQSIPSRTTLEVPAVPSSRFVLPHAPSDLLSRVQAFLPQMKAANDQLDMTIRPDNQAQHIQDEVADSDHYDGPEEAVTLEVLSSDSSDDSSDSSDSSSDASDEGSDDGSDQDMEQTGTDEQAMSHLLNIGSRPKIVRKKIVQEATDTTSQT